MISVRGKSIETLFSADQIAAEVARLAGDIAKDAGENLLVVSVLKGAFVFTADLIRAMHGEGLSPEVEFISLSSYGAGTEPGKVQVIRDIACDVSGRHVLIVDDILESGHTLRYTKNLMNERGAARTDIVVLLDKTMKRKADIEATHVGFPCPDVFVVGYGLDAGHAFRELPFVGHVVEPAKG